MFAWLENRVRICEALVLGSVLVLVGKIVIVDDYFRMSSALSICSPNIGFQFGYRKRNGPATWKEHYENALGEMQSPINIVTCDAVIVRTSPLLWSNHESVPEIMIMHNDGYSVTIQGIWKSGKPQITGLALDCVNYVFNRLYFHWGPTDTEGSEHTINYERYPLEVHAIYLKEGYNKLMDAHYEKCSNGILIIAFLFEIAPVDNPSFLHTVTENLFKIRNPRSHCYIEPFPLSDIFPQFGNSYFKYDGSITQPPCSEIVRYIIQTETIAISRRQMAMFRKLIAFDGFMRYLGVGYVKVEYTLTWVGCSVILLGEFLENFGCNFLAISNQKNWEVAAVQLLNNDIDFSVLSDLNCSDLSRLKMAKISAKSESGWKYGYEKDDGPLIWPLKFKECSGKRQSPIDFDTIASVLRNHPRLYWWNYNRKPARMILFNNGHTAMLKCEWKNAAEVPSFWFSSGNVSESQENYVFEQLHFHWGSNHSVGSEHTINSFQFPLEMHVVHRKRKFRNFPEAMEAGDESVLVIAVLFQVSKHENKALSPITARLRNIRTAGRETELNPFELRRLLSEFSSYFLMYNGSLTSPPCTEGVAWVVKLEISTISVKQLSEFRLLRNEKNRSISDNYRPVQPLNGRSVWHIK